MCKYMYRGLFAIALAFYGCIGSNSIISREMQSRAAIDGDGEPITMDTTLDYIDMSATTVKDLKEFIVPGYEDKVTAPQVENIITNSIRVSTVTETVGNWTWVDGEYKEDDDDIKTFGLWYKDGKWHAYVTDILTPKVGQRFIFQTASVEGNESDTSVTMNFSEVGSNFTFNRNGDKILTAYEVDVYTAELDEATGAIKTEKTKLEVDGLKMYKSEPFIDMGNVTNCHYLVVNESDKGNITRFGNAPAAPDAEEILIKSESDSETGKLIGYFVRIKKKDVLGLVYKPEVQEYADMKIKLDQIAALEPPSSTVRDLITWANAVQSILKGDLMGGDSSISPAAVLSSSNKYYWDEQTETCYRMTIENDYTIMRAVTNVPPTVEVVLALEKELNKETNK